LPPADPWFPPVSSATDHRGPSFPLLLGPLLMSEGGDYLANPSSKSGTRAGLRCFRNNQSDKSGATREGGRPQSFPGLGPFVCPARLEALVRRSSGPPPLKGSEKARRRAGRFTRAKRPI
jgi:hypothetical protein